MEPTITSQPADHRNAARLGNFTSAHLGKFEPALTRIRRSCRSASELMTLCSIVLQACCAMPSTPATPWPTALGSPTAANSTNHTPSGKSRCASREFQKFCGGFSGLPVGRSRQCPASDQPTTSVCLGWNFIRRSWMSFLGLNELAAERGEGLRPQFAACLKALRARPLWRRPSE